MKKRKIFRCRIIFPAALIFSLMFFGCASIDTKESGKTETDVRAIKINEHTDARWDRKGFWDSSGSFAHVYGGTTTGCFIYSFQGVSGKIQQISISARLSAEFAGKGASPKDVTDVTVFINDVEVETKQVIHDNFYGEIYTWEILCPELIGKMNIQENNQLKFEVKDDAENKRGLCIYGRALNTEEEKKANPVTVILSYIK